MSHPDVKVALQQWFKIVQAADWSGPQDVKRMYPSASFLEDNRVVFNVKGNHYRLIVRITYQYKMVQIKFVGTHAEYDKINANTVQHEN